MSELSTGQFAKLHQVTLKHVNSKMKRLGIAGRKDNLDKRLTILTDDEQALLLPHVVANRKQPKPEPIAEVIGEFIEVETIAPFTNTVLDFHVADNSSEISAIREDSKNLALQTASNFAGLRSATIKRVRAQARQDAAIAMQVYQSEFQSVLNEDSATVYGTSTTTTATTSTTVKKSVGQS